MNVMFESESRKGPGRVVAKARTAAAPLLCVLTLSLSAASVAHGKPVPWGEWRPSDLQLLCQNEGGVYGPPSSEGGVYYCLLPDGTLYTCGSDGKCTKDAARSSTSRIQDQLDLAEDKHDLLNSKLDRLAAQLSTLQNFLTQELARNPNLVPVPDPATPGPAGFCQRDAQGRLHVQIANRGTADAGETVTTVDFGCGNPQLCSAPTQVDRPTPALPKLGGLAELVFDIPASCFSSTTNHCNFEIRADAGNAVEESDEANDRAGDCGPQIE